MVTLISGYGLVFWAAVILTVVFFLDLATCWWATSLKICPLRKYRDKICKYHKYIRVLLLITVVVHITLHVLFEYGVVF